MSARCEVGCRSDEPCEHEAVALAIAWGYPGADEMRVCVEHARLASSDGADLRDPKTGEMLWM